MKYNKHTRYILLPWLALLTPWQLCAQSAQQPGGPKSIYEERDFLGFTTTSPAPITIGTAAEYQNGKYSDASSSILLAFGIAWTISVRTQSADLTSGVNTIPVSNVTIQVVDGAFGTGIKTLSTSPQVVASGILALAASFSFRYTMAGGAHLLKPAGSYTVQVIFTTTGL